jgi:hypothetical protein
MNQTHAEADTQNYVEHSTVVEHSSADDKRTSGMSFGSAAQQMCVGALKCADIIFWSVTDFIWFDYSGEGKELCGLMFNQYPNGYTREEYYAEEQRKADRHFNDVLYALRDVTFCREHVAFEQNIPEHLVVRGA